MIGSGRVAENQESVSNEDDKPKDFDWPTTFNNDKKETPAQRVEARAPYY
jgi:hypothetical protein